MSCFASHSSSSSSITHRVSLAKSSTASSTGYRNIEFTYIPTYDLAGAKGVGNKEVVIGGKRVRVTGFHGFQELPSSDLDT